ncbi:hypothetical protein [Sporomusa acidovorans]|uniref:Uncharacterized protein n=1 Tax=Sporomusa acidovorans (strain ATCC 49682 / DSM 3132 / Mol) TaxID=1123286 RepID=A0ABZ3IYC0_SPOA4|nr:hypothetical protein [Sporomusa acidovorans]OZC16807.1 hypothetical protein SPACI_40270 [Sporomusa acidovorans DSM 3132]SDF79196.1 hypothetical protein SAMN04488499_108410 [Sporomusa acidovorans]
MRDYCGKNGCYEIFQGDNEDQEVLCIYLNSPLIHEYFGEKFIRTTSKNRIEPEIEFTIDIISFDDVEEDDTAIASMLVDKFGVSGVTEFLVALFQYEITDKYNLIKAVQELLDKDNAVWGIVQPNEDY